MKVIGLAGWSGAGKTTLLTRVIPHLLAKGLRVSVIKHAHHNFDVDVPGKDSWVHRQAGADRGAGILRQALGPDARIARRRRAAAAGTAWQNVAGRSRGGRRFQVRAASQDRGASRSPTASRCCFPSDPAIAGIATDTAVETTLPVAHLDDIPAIAAMMQRSAISVEDVLARSSIES